MNALKSKSFVSNVAIILAATLVFSALFYSAAVMAIRIFSLSDFEKVPVFGKIINFFSKFIYEIKKKWYNKLYIYGVFIWNRKETV